MTVGLTPTIAYDAAFIMDAPALGVLLYRRARSLYTRRVPRRNAADEPSSTIPHHQPTLAPNICFPPYSSGSISSSATRGNSCSRIERSSQVTHHGSLPRSSFSQSGALASWLAERVRFVRLCSSPHRREWVGFVRSSSSVRTMWAFGDSRGS